MMPKGNLIYKIFNKIHLMRWWITVKKMQIMYVKKGEFPWENMHILSAF
jgi:hypothetical protein